jgi:hypothetical protein
VNSTLGSVNSTESALSGAASMTSAAGSTGVFAFADDASPPAACACLRSRIARPGTCGGSNRLRLCCLCLCLLGEGQCFGRVGRPIRFLLRLIDAISVDHRRAAPERRHSHLLVCCKALLNREWRYSFLSIAARIPHPKLGTTRRFLRKCYLRVVRTLSAICLSSPCPWRSTVAVRGTRRTGEP